MKFWKTEKADTLPVNWIGMKAPEDVDRAIAASKEQQVAIFKHSTRCGISSTAYNRLSTVADSGNSVPVFFIDVILHRDISNLVENRLGVKHESPQLLLLRNGKVEEHFSHLAIEGSQIIRV
ncbi:MAG: bacillithiol system redox-active protein YtxJ [Salibacteraceae bacterium]